MSLNKKEINEFRDLVRKGATPEQAKQILKDNKQGGIGITNAFVDMSRNIYKGVENFSADAINIPLSMFTDARVKPISEALIPTGEEYKGGLLQRSVDTIGKRGKELGEAVEFGVEGEQSKLESGFQGATKTVRGVLDIGGDVFISTLSTLIPDKQKEQLKNKLQEIVETEGGQAVIEFTNELMDNYELFKQENPRAGRNVDGLGTIIEGTAEIFGYKAVKAGVKEGKHLASEGVGNLQKQMETIIKEKESVLPKESPIETMGSRIYTSKLRETEEIAGNILQPYKGMTENLADANLGLQRIIQESDILTNPNSTFSDLMINAKQLLAKYGRTLDKELKTIPGTYKDTSIESAVTQLKKVYEGTMSKENTSILAKLDDLETKLNNQGLTISEINDLKILHTKANNLFNEKGQATGGFASDDLRAIRKELKVLVENIADENGVTNIKELNKIYGELSDTKGLLDNQIANLKAYKGRTLPETMGSKIGQIIGRIPIISGGVRGALSELGVTLRSDKINPIEVQKRLPKLLKELDKAGMARGEIKKFQEELSEALKQLPAEGQSSFKEGPRVTPQTKDRGIIQESKEELKNAKIRLTKDNTKAENYDVAKQSIVDINNPEVLIELREDIKDLGLARENELLKMIDEKIKMIDDINKVDEVSVTLRNEYGDDLIESFRDIYKNEIKLKTTKGGDKYTTVEFNKTAGFKKFSDDAQEYINTNPWVGDKTVQELYDELKDKMLDENITALKKNIEIERKEVIKTLEGITGKNTQTISKKIASQLRTTEIEKVQKIIGDYIKKYGKEIKDYIGELLDELADTLGTRMKLMGNDGIGVEKTKLLGQQSAIKNYEKKVLMTMLKEARETGKMPLPSQLEKGFMDKIPLLERKARLDEVRDFIKSKVTLKNEAKEVLLKPKEIVKKPKTTAETYGMQHRPTKNGATADDISKNGEVIPKDFYETPQFYFNMKDKTYKESFDILKKIKGNPNAEVTIYRAGSKNQFNEGDWVTLSKTYAQEHMERQGSKGVFSMKVKAKDIQYAGDDINEFGYFPKANKPKLLKKTK